MCELLMKLDNLKRPRLLIRAARLGMAEYRRDVHLRRHLGHGPLPNSVAALERLVELELWINDQRQTGAAAYSSTQHVDLMIAVMAEARILRASNTNCAPPVECVR